MRQQVATTSNASGGPVNSNVIVLDSYSFPQVALQAVVNGAATFTVQQTLDNVNDPTITPTWFPHSDPTLVGATGNVQGNYAYAPAAIRLQQTAGAGSVRLTVIQAGQMT